MSSVLLQRILVSVMLLLSGLRAAQAEPALVLSSIRPLQLIVQSLAGDTFEAREIPGIGAEPHDFALRPSTIRLLESADLVLWFGPTLEHTLAIALGRIKNPREQALLALMPADSGIATDPHIWLDPQLAAVLATVTAEVLVRHGLLSRAQAEERLAALLAATSLAEQDIRSQLHGLEAAPFAVMHDGYSHFVQRFGLNQVFALSLDEEHQPGARTLARMRALARDSEAVCLLLDNAANQRLAATLAEGSAMRIAQVDPLALLVAADSADFPLFLRDFGRTVAACLRDAPAPSR